MENDPKSSIYGVILRMRKRTLNRAYAPMSSHPDSEDLFGMKLLYDIIIFFLCGCIGWTGTLFLWSELLLVTKQFRKVLNQSLSFLILFLFQLLIFQKVLIGFEFFKFCDFWLFAIFKSFRFPSAMDDDIEKRNYQTLLEYVMYNFYVSCPYNQVYGSDLTNLEVLAIFYSSSNIK